MSQQGKNPSAMQKTGNVNSIPASGRSRGGVNGNPPPVFLPGKSHGQRSLTGYSPWGRNESDMTEHAGKSERSTRSVPCEIYIFLERG